ncbi:MAG TPA: bifunctional serine/threonine-protein kinase/formylglycine-generating enzyme family protein [Candidatus Sericytochromatia bacterium]|jgi:formylglycine-generating enzyme required for sulfatase activity
MLGNTLASRYKIVKHLGAGGFGQTFLAQDTQLPGKPLCVVKQLKPQSNDPYTLQVARRLFDTEAKILYKLGDYDQIPRLLAHFEENREFYLVQQFIEGEELSQEMTRGQRWSEVQVIALLQDILKTLAFVHQENVIHRDLKPANLIRRRMDGKIVLIDFGAVKEIIPKSTNSVGQSGFTVGIGTLGYMPSEQANGKPKLSSDVYAVGVIAIQALTGLDPGRGQLPEDSKTGEIIWRNYAQVNPKLANVLDKMVRHDFRQRYPSAAEALQALPQQQPIWTRRKFIKVAGVGGVGLVGAIVAHQAFNHNSPSPAPKRSVREAEETTSPPTSLEQGGQSGNTLQSFAFEVVRVDAQGRETSRNRRQAQYFTEDLGNGVTLDMVVIPGGTFLMGSPDTEAKRLNSESPQHSVSIKPFYMGKFTVTQAQWRAVAALPQVSRALNPAPSYFKGDNLPVEQISWEEAVEFCQRLSQKTGRIYRLPSEAEWEYACRAGTTTPFHFGETITSDLANYDGTDTYASEAKGTYREKTTPVGSFQVANAFGLYDMHGNVWEWCADPWHPNYRDAPSDGRAWDNDGDNRYRLLRGGSWYYSPWLCRSAFRYLLVAGNGYDNLGFRVVCAAARTS